MIYQLFTGQWLELDHILVVSEPYIRKHDCDWAQIVFKIEFMFREKPISFYEKVDAPDTLFREVKSSYDYESIAFEYAQKQMPKFMEKYNAFISYLAEYKKSKI